MWQHDLETVGCAGLVKSVGMAAEGKGVLVLRYSKVTLRLLRNPMIIKKKARHGYVTGIKLVTKRAFYRPWRAFLWAKVVNTFGVSKSNVGENLSLLYIVQCPIPGHVAK